jgi:hypothetical protein
MKHSWKSFWLTLVLAVFLPLWTSIAPIRTSHAGPSPAFEVQRGVLSPITIVVDATDAPRKILHARLTIPVKPGPLTLFYPKWIPGEHGPTGPITDLAGLKFTAAGKTVAWRRDDVDMFAFHLEVPTGTSTRWQPTLIFSCRPQSKDFPQLLLRPQILWCSVGTRCCCIRKAMVQTI